MGVAPTGLAGMRSLVRGTHRLRHYKPAAGAARAWESAARRVAATV